MIIGRFNIAFSTNGKRQAAADHKTSKILLFRLTPNAANFAWQKIVWHLPQMFWLALAMRYSIEGYLSEIVRS